MGIMTTPLTVLTVSLALLLLPGYEGSVVGIPAPTMVPVGDIREQTVAALDRPGLFARVRTQPFQLSRRLALHFEGSRSARLAHSVRPALSREE